MTFFALALILYTSSTQAQNELVSATRALDVDYQEMIKTVSLASHESIRKSALKSARRFPQAKLPKATAWRKDQLLPRFQKMRDARFLKENVALSPRRASWLYPDDGCFARASLANRNLFRWYHPVPSKVFAFGNLRVKTKNSPRGVVGWWYHVAPIVEVAGEKYVLDPAIEPLKPLLLLEWLQRMGKPEKMKVAICASGTYTPGDNCAKETDGLELSAERTQRHYLKLEERRLKTLRRPVALELGDRPPWLVQ